jgi:hypothetical protein
VVVDWESVEVQAIVGCKDNKAAWKLLRSYVNARWKPLDQSRICDLIWQRRRVLTPPDLALKAQRLQAAKEADAKAAKAVAERRAARAAAKVANQSDDLAPRGNGRPLPVTCGTRFR